MKSVAKGILPAVLLSAMGMACGSGSSTGTPGTGPYVPLKVGNQWTYQVTEADGTVRTKLQGVTGETLVGGDGPHKDVMAFRLVTGTKFNDPTGDVSFQGTIDSRVVRFRELSIGANSGLLQEEQYWDPAKLRVDDTDAHTTQGAAWPESYAEHKFEVPDVVADAGVAATPDGGTAADAGGNAGLIATTETITDLWSVVAVNESVTVPAGTFTALKLKRIQQNNASIKYFWFVRGVGKVKEGGEIGSSEQTEELVRYTAMP